MTAITGCLLPGSGTHSVPDRALERVARAPGQVLSSVITASPCRLSFFGGGTDLPEYFETRGGLVIATTMRHFSYVALNSLPRLLERRFRISYSQLEMVDRVEEIRHDIIRATLGEHPELIADRFVDIHSYADLPVGTGIGSSSAFTVGLLNALHAVCGMYLPPRELARRAIGIEREKLGEHGGWQDQVLSAFGGFNLVRFQDREFEVFPLPLGSGMKQAIESCCWLYFTAVTRSSSAVQRTSHGGADGARLRLLDETREIAEEALRVLRAGEDPGVTMRRWGELLHHSWMLKRRLSGAVSMPAIDLVYERARDAGAWGGKLVGAGGGGFLLIAGPPERRAAIDAAVGGLTRFAVRLEQHGSHVVYVNERD
jgi:D-glycero-alpha-D-manno-heptose-7-phosphate kinase